MHEIICCAYSLQTPWQGSSKEYPQPVLWRNTVFTLSIRTPQLLTIYVLKFEPVQFTARCCV